MFAEFANSISRANKEKSFQVIYYDKVTKWCVARFFSFVVQGKGGLDETMDEAGQTHTPHRHATPLPPACPDNGRKQKEVGFGSGSDG